MGFGPEPTGPTRSGQEGRREERVSPTDGDDELEDPAPDDPAEASWHQDPDELVDLIRATHPTGGALPVVRGYRDLQELSPGGMRGFVATYDYPSRARRWEATFLAPGLRISLTAMTAPGGPRLWPEAADTVLHSLRLAGP